MMRMRPGIVRTALVAAAALVLSCRLAGGPTGSASGDSRRPAEGLATARAVEAIDDARLRAAGADPASWITHGGTYAEQRHSPLAKIDASNVSQLGLAWFFDTDTNRGLEATPLVVGGVIYTTGSWSIVYAIDARTGRELWRHDPQVPKEKGARACCDVVNRGVALYDGRVYAGTLDGRLQALDAATGGVVWSVQTTDPAMAYTITGAPRVVEGRVVIGNGGAELGVRGYLSAYDPRNGALVWRFYTVPGDPSKPQESKALDHALKTWTGDTWWKAGGGGTVWDSMAYDPELRLLYVGTGNGSPWSHYARSPKGGDNLYLSSVLALRPDTGELVWHYQETPGDRFDYTATQHMILAELPIDGRSRKVLMHAPKNGFFYVLDRETGTPISAEKYVEVTWAERIDLRTGRPVMSKSSDYRTKPALVKPSTFGGHNWHPMSFHPGTGLVYIPAQEIPILHQRDPNWRFRAGRWNTATDLSVLTELPREAVSGHLLAWDPVRQREAWRVPHVTAWNGGVLSTAGNLVFQGTADGRFVAYTADTGEKRWEFGAQTGVIAAPVTYELDGKQYVAVMAGWGGAFALAGGDAAAAAGVRAGGRLLAFRLGGTAALPPPPPPAPPLGPPTETPPPALAKRGEGLYAANCGVCHGLGAVSGGVLPDLRLAQVPRSASEFEAVVLGGVRAAKGMPSFADRLSIDDATAVRAYVLQRAIDAAKGAPATAAGGL